ncbi:hypothetical protein HMPREF0682_2010 [Propionibacterium acidifaciens F0233]|uniref:Uncharacterized protein n=1 Tax=Propionibacterium acidifaciens F0233 TaxID=553198 RepID=U2RXJ1_9ACTN|nr:hypothetical protein [Propionibacterium acidifaciens]AYW76995.1 hypothetical protein EGX94_01895 [Propionibacterium acidifaciens]ERK55342.1 hypothetical protein HMPREF0682_2010 [Propionibacterium acidifaciens F0233]
MSASPQDDPAEPEAVPGPRAGEPPVTGNRLVDGVLAELAGVDALPVGERLERLTAAQQGLAEILDGTRAESPDPGRRP